jgi:peptidoglycan/xylan/chitin deacetylase (PgdA/CDA1 family)
MAKQCAAGADLASPPEPQMHVMRFPYGTCDAKSLAMLADNGFLAIQWDLVTGDPDPHITAKGIINNILTHAHPGAIVVMHANGRGKNTAAALSVAIPKLKAEGYSFVTVSELIAAGKPIIAANCYLNRPGDAVRHVARLHKRPSDDLWSKLGLGH